MPLTFITGPVRSGKSRFALKLARMQEAGGARVIYAATASLGADDPEWRERIARHRAERDPAWSEIETAAPGAPALTEVARSAPAGDVLVVDSTGTWLAARIDAHLAGGAPLDPRALEREAEETADALAAAVAHAIVVGDEVGWSIVPEYPSGRLFRDVLGRMHQRLAGAADRAYLIVAGRAVDLTGNGTAI